MLHRDPALPGSASDYYPAHIDPEMIYVLIIPSLRGHDDAQFQSALQELRALPARDWVSYSNRAGVLFQVDDVPGAFEMSSRAIELAPNEPAAQNNHCGILYGMERYAEALEYCQAAASGAPNVAAARDSLADVLAALGRCDEARRENAEARRLDPSNPVYAEPVVCNAA